MPTTRTATLLTLLLASPLLAAEPSLPATFDFSPKPAANATPVTAAYSPAAGFGYDFNSKPTPDGKPFGFSLDVPEGNYKITLTFGGGVAAGVCFHVTAAGRTDGPWTYTAEAGKKLSGSWDTTAQGGFQYAYRVRGVSNDVEGAPSNCVDTLSATQCTLQPNHQPDSLVVQGNTGAACHIGLGWQAGSSNCPGADPSMNYALKRSTDPYFAGATPLATIPATSDATFKPALLPLSVGTVRRSAASSTSPARSANASTGTRPADDTRFGSSNTADTARDV